MLLKQYYYGGKFKCYGDIFWPVFRSKLYRNRSKFATTANQFNKLNVKYLVKVCS